MVVEYPLTEFHHRLSFLFWPYQLALTLRLGLLCRRLGVTAVLKRHPDRLTESMGVYDAHFDQLLAAPFEEVCSQADAFIFPSIASTTFAVALLTNRPVIFFETALLDVWEELHAPLKKRCRVIPAWTDEEDRLVFDEKALADALRRPPEAPDTQFLEEYLFP